MTWLSPDPEWLTERVEPEPAWMYSAEVSETPSAADSLGRSLSDREALTSGSAEGGSCHTVNCGIGFGFGLAFTGGAVGELEAFAGLALTVGLGPLVTVSGLAPVK